MIRGLPTFPDFPELFRRIETPYEESIATISEAIQALPNSPELSQFSPNSPERLKMRGRRPRRGQRSCHLERHCFLYRPDTKVTEEVRSMTKENGVKTKFPPDLVLVKTASGKNMYLRVVPQTSDVRGIDCDYSRNDPSTPDLA
ncbi:hypothetical protein NQ317_007610 [Molorchus minor]|uniref:Uncharacterized protein n=1 Tax=Molorchus minor TaxID=1323400 RepID=A0ABQ9JP61_9CUCU|nr:hypothetical protein NQ317_007610 [Molorchus minor]